MVSLFDLIVLWLMIGIPVAIGLITADQLGLLAGVAIGLLSGVICISIGSVLYRSRWRAHNKQLKELKARYRWVYQVVAIPADLSKARMAEGTVIKVEDYGWEAEPLKDDGLIYLQGLTLKWRVVWHAGFSAEQLRRVCLKPRSQHEWDHSWFSNPPPCPYPIQPRQTADMGLPRVLKWK